MKLTLIFSDENSRTNFICAVDAYNALLKANDTSIQVKGDEK